MNTLYHLDNTFCGVKMAQAWYDLMLWEDYLNLLAPRTILELGAYQGGFSLYLYIQAKRRQCHFQTYDISYQLSSPVAHILHDHFRLCDIFANAEYLHSSLRESERPVLLFCDNGHKIREVREFSSDLQHNDGLVVHDVGTEIHETDIPSAFEKLFLQETETNATRFFIKRS